MKNKMIAAVLSAVIVLAACAAPGEQNQYGMGNKQTVGGLGGAVLGGYAGSAMGRGNGRLWTTGAGALVGALLGSDVGRSLDQSDRMYNEQAWSRANDAPLNQRVAWNNPDNGHSGYITPVRDGRNTYGSPCREYQQTIVVGGQAQSAYGTACRNDDGSWALVNE
jgi:surface antigen